MTLGAVGDARDAVMICIIVIIIIIVMVGDSYHDGDDPPHQHSYLHADATQPATGNPTPTRLSDFSKNLIYGFLQGCPFDCLSVCLPVCCLS